MSSPLTSFLYLHRRRRHQGLVVDHHGSSYTITKSNNIGCKILSNDRMPCRTRVASFLHQRCFFIFGTEDNNKRRAASLRSEATSPVLEELVVLSLVCERTGQYRVRSARRSSPVRSSTRSTVDLVGSSATNSAKVSLTAAMVGEIGHTVSYHPNRNHETDRMLDVRATYIPPKRRRLNRSEVKRLNYQQLTRSVAPFLF